MRIWPLSRKRPELPCGYRVEDAQGALRLFDPDGVLLQEEAPGPSAILALDWRAWHDAWAVIEREIVRDLQAFKSGTHSISELRRLRQYRRMLDAVAATPHPLRTEGRRDRLITGVAIAVSAAVLGIAIFTGPVTISQSPAEPPRRERGSDAGAAAERPIPPASPSPSETTQDRARVAGTRDTAAPRPALKPPQPAVRSSSVAYIVSLGEFPTQEAAEARMRLVRSKGHVVYVARIGDAFHVVSKPYRSREQAERVATGLQDIGLPARAQVAGPSLL